MKINKVIKVLITADLLFMSGISLVAPVFAIFLLNSIRGGSATLAGAAVAVYLVVKSVLRLPIAYYLDKSDGEKDDFYAMIIGYLMITISSFLYLLARTPLHVYLIQAFLGVGGALAFTPWLGFFTRHIDKHHESFEWSVNVSLAGAGMAIAGLASGIIVDNFGFASLFVASGVLSFFGTIILFLIGRNLKPDKASRRLAHPVGRIRHI